MLNSSAGVPTFDGFALTNEVSASSKSVTHSRGSSAAISILECLRAPIVLGSNIHSGNAVEGNGKMTIAPMTSI